MIFISGIKSLIIQNNTLCTNKIRVIYFLPKLLIFLFWRGGATAPPAPPLPPPARAPMVMILTHLPQKKHVCCLMLSNSLKNSREGDLSINYQALWR